MSNQSSGLDPARSRLRATVAEIEAQLGSLTKNLEKGDETHALLVKAWADLVGQLALGPEPEVRSCPKCNSVGMRLATVCSVCWSKLTPLPLERSAGA